MSREQFEQLVTVPEWAAFDPVHGYSNPEWQDLDPATNFVRLDELSRINAAWCAYQFRQPEIDALRAENAELCKRVKELEADAARYRWLRGECESPNGGLTIASVTEWGLEGWSGDDPDNRIDAAMQEGKS